MSFIIPPNPPFQGGDKRHRKPAHLEYAGGKSPRQQIWEKIRELKRFELSELAGAMPGTIHRDTTRCYVKALVAGGYLNHQPDHPYELIKDNGVEAPRLRKDGSAVEQGRKQENLWRTLRTVNHPVNPVELVALAGTDAHPIALAFARDYLANLHHAGYVNKVGGQYHLLPAMNTGPRPPMIQRIKQVYDPNLGKIMWTETKGDNDE
jgi:hypothetical protein